MINKARHGERWAALKWVKIHGALRDTFCWKSTVEAKIERRHKLFGGGTRRF